MNDAFATIGVIFAMGLTAISLYGALIWVNHLSRKLKKSTEEPTELTELRERVALLEAELGDQGERDEIFTRLQEAEERLDFAERLIGRSGARVELPTPSPSGENSIN